MELLGAVVGVVVGLILSRVRTYPIALQAVLAMAGVAATAWVYYGLTTSTPRPWLFGLMAFALVTCTNEASELWRARHGAPRH
jgi:hypothetical protein